MKIGLVLALVQCGLGEYGWTVFGKVKVAEGMLGLVGDEVTAGRKIQGCSMDSLVFYNGC